MTTDDTVQILADAEVMRNGLRMVRASFNDAVDRMNGFPGDDEALMRYSDSMQTLEAVIERIDRAATAGIEETEGPKVVGQDYGDLILPNLPDYCRCPYASRTRTGEPIMGVSFRHVETYGYGLRPSYTVVVRVGLQSYMVGYDYNPNIGIWRTSDVEVPFSKAKKGYRKNGAQPLKGFELQEVLG